MTDQLFTGPHSTWEAEVRVLRTEKHADAEAIAALRARVAELDAVVDGIWRYAVDTTVSDHHFRGWAEVEARAALQEQDGGQ